MSPSFLKQILNNTIRRSTLLEVTRYNLNGAFGFGNLFLADFTKFVAASFFAQNKLVWNSRVRNRFFVLADSHANLVVEQVQHAVQVDVDVMFYLPM